MRLATFRAHLTCNTRLLVDYYVSKMILQFRFESSYFYLLSSLRRHGIRVETSCARYKVAFVRKDLLQSLRDLALDSMIPVRRTVLPRLPTNANGKVDCQLLRTELAL